MKRHVLICGIIGGGLITLLKWSEYQFLVIDHSVEIYAGLTAVIFAAFGIWLGIRLTGPRQQPLPQQLPAPPAPSPLALPFTPDHKKRDDLGITRRELEILELVALGLSNREIASRLFVSENTVKTHCSRTFDKLGARRRTEAVQLGKQQGLLP